MNKEHPIFKPPKNRNAKIWRYMDFTKYVSLLDKSALHFSRVDQLDDPFEGSCPLVVLEYLNKETNFGGSNESSKYIFKRLNKCTAVNSWHLNEDESPAMWKMYLKSNEGIAVQSTYKKLTDSIKDKKHGIRIGKVEYIDYRKLPKTINPQDVFPFTYCYKREIFRHEEELRAVIRKYPRTKFFPSRPLISVKGINIDVDLDILVDKIYLAPTCPIWQLELLRSIMKRYKLDKEVIQSSIYDEPYRD